MNSTISIVGNLVRDPEVRYSQNGNPRCYFTVAVNEGQGDNEKTHFMDVTVFGTLADNFVASCSKGQRVFCEGRLDSFSQETTRDGKTFNEQRIKMIANIAGPDLRWATAQVTKASKSSNGSTGNGAPAQNGAPDPEPAPAAAAPAQDPNDQPF